MIDFKFHVVSLIAVFMALAVGILLGAGPLGGALGDTLESQLQELRADRETMRTELAQARGNLDDADALLEEAGPRLVDGTLEGGRVALLAVPGAEEADVNAIREAVLLAGGQVVVQGILSETLVAPDLAEERIELAERVVPDADPDADPVHVLAAAIADGITVGRDEVGGLEDAAADGELLDVILATGTDLVAFDSDPEDRADVLVVVASRAMEVPEPSQEDADEDGTPDAEAASAERRVILLTALQAYGAMSDEAPMVLVGAGESEWDLVRVARDDAAAAPLLTTVDSIGSVAATVLTPLAAAAALEDVVQHYGVDPGAQSVLPPAVLSPAERRSLNLPGDTDLSWERTESATAGTT